MQYLDKKELLNNITYTDIKVEDLISADTYNEEGIMKNFNTIEKKGQELLLKCAIHISIIGAGNKTYGMIRDEKNIVLEIKNIFNKYNIIYNKNINEKYDKSQLSARRLVRLLRYHIQKFIEIANRPSYLWFKYSDQNKEMIKICFPGGEHLVENKEQALYLLKTYKNLDTVLKTQFVKRLERIFIARKIFEPAFFVNLNI